MSIHAFAIVGKGFEKAVADNIQELAEVSKIHTLNTLIKFEAKNYHELCRVVYTSQAVNRVLLFIGEMDYSENIDASEADFTSIDKNLEHMLSTLNIIREGSSFRVSLQNSTTDYVDKDIEGSFGQHILEFSKQKNLHISVNLKKPDVTFYIYISNSKMYFGIDLSGDLSKRDYKIFNNPMSLKGTTAFGLLKIADYKPSESILDVFCNSGVLEVEAALYANKIPHRIYNKDFPFMKLKLFGESDNDTEFEKLFKEIDGEKKNNKLNITASDPLLRNITAAKKNAKIAGVEKFIDFRRIDTDWLDTKFEKRSIDKIITFIPGSSKHRNPKELEKSFTEFFYQAEFIIKKTGLVVVMCLSKDLLIKSSEKYFEIDKEHEVFSGDQSMSIIFFKILSKKEKDAITNK